MDVSVESQVFIFLATVAGGMCIGLIYDFFRIARKTFKTGFFVLQIEDLIFWIVTTVFVFLLLFFVNSGEIRFYEFLGLTTGVVLYSFFISRFVMRISLWLIGVLKRILIISVRILVFPVALIYKLIRRPILAVWSPIKSFFVFLRRLKKHTVNNCRNSLKFVKKRLRKI